MQQFMSGLVGNLPRAAALTAVVAVMGLATPAHAVLVYSGPVSIAVPDTIDGIYLNVVTGAASSDALGAAGWDVNPYSALAGQFNLWGPTTTTWLSPSGVIGGPYPLAVGTEVGAAGLYFRPGGGTNVGAQVTLGAVNYFGFRFANEAAGGATNYGVLEVTFGASAGSRAITGWLYDDAGGSVIAGPVPEPETYALWLAGLAAVAGAARRGMKKS
jgi:PEP-CTERM motif